MYISAADASFSYLLCSFCYWAQHRSYCFFAGLQENSSRAYKPVSALFFFNQICVFWDFCWYQFLSFSILSQVRSNFLLQDRLSSQAETKLNKFIFLCYFGRERHRWLLITVGSVINIRVPIVLVFIGLYFGWELSKAANKLKTLHMCFSFMRSIV